MSDWRLDAIGQHDDSPPPPPADESHGPDTGGDTAEGARRKVRRGVAGTVMLVAVAGFGGALWYAYDTYRTQGGAGIAPLIRADLEPTRIKPEQPGGMDVPHRDRLVLQDPSGEPEEAAATTVVNSAEEPLPAPEETAADDRTAEAATDTVTGRGDAAGDALDDGADPIGAIIAGGDKPEPAPRSATPPKVDAAADSEGGDPPVQAAQTEATPDVPAVPAGEVQVAQLETGGVTSDAAAVAAPPTDAAAVDADAGPSRAAAASAAPAPDGTEALMRRRAPAPPPSEGTGTSAARSLQVAQATPDAGAEADAEADAESDADAAAEDDGAEGLPEISPTPQLAPAAEPTGSSAEAAAETPDGESAAAGDAGAEAASSETSMAAATQVVFAVPLGALDAAAAADLRVAEAIAPAGFDPTAALTAFGTRPSGLEGSATTETEAAETPAAEVGEAASAAAEPAAPAAETVAAAPPPPALPEGAWRVQLAAVTSQAEAEEEWSRFQTRFPGLLGNLELIVPTALIDGRTWYRVQAGPLDEGGARRLCVQLKEQGADCIVRQ